ncbi:MAG: hypothetical protein ACOX3W_08220 [Christensenellaceae bacterium]
MNKKLRTFSAMLLAFIMVFLIAGPVSVYAVREDPNGVYLTPVAELHLIRWQKDIQEAMLYQKHLILAMYRSCMKLSQIFQQPLREQISKLLQYRETYLLVMTMIL